MPKKEGYAPRAVRVKPPKPTPKKSRAVKKDALEVARTMRKRRKKK